MQTIKDLQRKIDCDLTHLVKSVAEDFDNAEKMLKDWQDELKMMHIDMEITPVMLLQKYMTWKFDLGKLVVLLNGKAGPVDPKPFLGETAEIEVNEGEWKREYGAEFTDKSGEEIAKETNEANKNRKDLNKSNSNKTNEVVSMSEDEQNKEAPQEEPKEEEKTEETAEAPKEDAPVEEEKEEETTEETEEKKEDEE